MPNDDLGQRVSRPTVDAGALARTVAGDQVSVAARVTEIAALEHGMADQGLPGSTLERCV